MAILTLLLLPVLEIYVLVQVGSRIGVINTLFALVAVGILGAGLAKAQGRYVIGRLQGSLGQGQMPANHLLQGLLLFIGGVLFLIPGFVTDVVALLMILPGTRHLMALWMRKKLEKALRTGGFKVFTAGTAGGPFGRGGFGGFGGPFPGGGPFPRETKSWEDEGRDVTPKVIDVTPISSSSRQKSDSDDGGSPKR